MRKIPDSRTSAETVQPKKRRSFQEVKIHSNATLRGISKVSRPRQEAVNFLSAAFRGECTAAPLPICPAPGTSASRGPGRRRAHEAEGARKERGGVRTVFRSTGQLALHYPRFLTAREVGDSWGKFNGLGEMLTSSIWALRERWRQLQDAKTPKAQLGRTSRENEPTWTPCRDSR